MESRIMTKVAATAREGYKPSDLKLADLQEVNFWVNTFEGIIDFTVFEYPGNDIPEEVARLMASVITDFREILFDSITTEVRDILISIIDNYEEEE